MLEAVAYAVEVEVQARLFEFAQTCLCRKTVEVRANTGFQQLALRDAGRQRFGAPANLASKAAEGPIEHLAVLHGMAPDLDDLLSLLAPIFPRDEIVTGLVGPVIGTHAGPGVIGVSFQTARP